MLTRAQSGLSQTRSLGVTAGVCALLILCVIPEGNLSERMAITALVALGFAAVVGWFEILTTRRHVAPTGVGQPSSQYWPAVTLAVALLAALAVQAWFQPGSSIATGDIPPPDGTAWLGRLFEPWTWSGSDLGGPSQLLLQLPWAAVLGLCHALGGDPALAQRIWYTALFVGAALGIFGLLAALRMSPAAAVAGTAVYVLSPYVISEVTINTVYLAALGLLAAIPAALVAAGTGRISVRLGAVLVATSAPLIGYVDLNPPLVGMLFAAMVIAPLVVAWVDGREAAFRSFRTLLLAVPLLVAASAYWIVPSIIHLSVVVTSQLAPITSWSWTEARASVRNAFWLNTFWAWPFPEYFTYSKTYESFPFSVLRFVLPAIALSALALGAVSQIAKPSKRKTRPRPIVADQSRAIANLDTRLERLGKRFEWGHIAEDDYLVEWERLVAHRVDLVTIQKKAAADADVVPPQPLMERSDSGDSQGVLREFRMQRELRLALAAATAALAIILLSTGTNPPGNTLFNRLYALPLGWLLREPGRFLVVASLAYAVLVAVVVERVVTGPWIARLVRDHRGWEHGSRMGVVAATVAVSVALGFPVYTGAVVPDSRPQLPSAHVHVPGYWTEMARSVDGLPIQGSMLIMPPDDFYAMPYSWGYYGTDDFIANFFHRRVVIPNGQGYSPATSQLVKSANLVAQSILDHHWQLTEALVTALNTPLILVRGDIQSSLAGRTILRPSDLSASLSEAPNFELVRQIGALDLFRLLSPTAETNRMTAFVTVNSETPDLRLLPLLPPNTALVSSVPMAGVANATQAPPLSTWTVLGDSLIWKTEAPPGWNYRVADLQSQTAVTLGSKGRFAIDQSNTQVLYEPGPTGDSITVSINGRSTIVNEARALVVVASPVQPTFNNDLVVWHTTYSTQWLGSNNGRHVLVDGMLNGWLIPALSPQFVTSYKPGPFFAAGEWISLAALIAALLLVAWGWRRQLRNYALKILTRRKLTFLTFSKNRAPERDDG